MRISGALIPAVGVCSGPTAAAPGAGIRYAWTADVP